MRQILFILTLFIGIVIVLDSCYYDSEEALYPSLSSACDTTSVTFSGQISSMLANYCLSCHSNASAGISGNGIRLENYSDVQSRTAAISGSIKQTGTYSPMPKNGGKLKPCLISQFDIWVRNGALNN
jgi:hypothetical protein